MSLATPDRGFFERDPREVAPALLGTLLTHGRTAGRIVETEAYLGTDDPAAHVYRGRTPRTAVLYGPGGHAYVYRTRQHRCLNVAVQQAGVPGCVLIRALAPVTGIAIMCRRRAIAKPNARLTNGPAKLCQALAIDMRHYGADLCGNGRLRIAIDPDHRPCPEAIAAGPRIGVTTAKDWPLRYFIVGEPHLSR